uniref:Uncharacterized protein n=1 Tax=Anguilla anguilla TaxID=7936 RepID=A0A0E9TP13_ANGAN
MLSSPPLSPTPFFEEDVSICSYCTLLWIKASAK